MTRVIKFRAWEPKNKIWLRSTAVNIELDGTVILNDYSQTPTVRMISKEIVLMQFTGLTDKNGKEIYEGDVVHYCSDMREMTGAVSYDVQTAAFMIGEKNHFSWFNENAAEIIGNIYENPELISKP